MFVGRVNFFPTLKRNPFSFILKKVSADLIMKDQTSPTAKLLLVDDDPNLILLVKDFLEFKGYQVVTAENGREALEMVDRELPDVIICDVMMPEMDGYTFVRHIRENSRTQHIDFVFLSAKGQSQDRVQGLKRGADVYMVKPFEPEELVAQVDSFIDRKQRGEKSGLRLSEDAPRLQVPKDVDLTQAETKVIRLLAQGMSNREIADQLKVSQRTIESHVSNMLNKTGLHNRTELARWAIENSIA